MYCAGFQRRKASLPDGSTWGDRAVLGASVRAFTLIELLVVVAIIGILAGIGLPALKGFGSSNALSAAASQLKDDLALARQTAMNQRSDVYVLFVGPEALTTSWPTLVTQADKNIARRLLNSQYTSYALYSKRQLGDQPGAPRERYLTPWRNLPEGVFISTNEFDNLSLRTPNLWQQATLTNRPFGFTSANIRFPTETGPRVSMAFVGFDYEGRLIKPSGVTANRGDEFIHLVKGTVLPAKNAQGLYDIAPAEVIETPKNNTTNNPVIQIDSTTGRGRVVRL